MKAILVPFLIKLNKFVLPSYYKKDLLKLSKLDKAFIGYKLWLAKQAARHDKPLAND